MLVEALTVLERAVVLGLDVVVFACSFASGDSDVFLMKKTPFYRMMRHKWRRKSLFTATKKYCRLLHAIWRRRQSLVIAVPGKFSVYA